MSNIIFKKSMALIGIGVLFLMVGAVYGLLSGDRLFVVMSAVIFSVNVYKVFELRKIVRENKYIVYQANVWKQNITLWASTGYIRLKAMMALWRYLFQSRLS